MMKHSMINIHQKLQNSATLPLHQDTSPWNNIINKVSQTNKPPSNIQISPYSSLSSSTNNSSLSTRRRMKVKVSTFLYNWEVRKKQKSSKINIDSTLQFPLLQHHIISDNESKSKSPRHNSTNSGNQLKLVTNPTQDGFSFSISK